MKFDSNRSTSPLLSVILVTPDCYQNLATTIRTLRAQTIRERIEIVIVAPDSRTLDMREDDLLGFAGVQIVLLGKILSIGTSYAAGVRRATAPIVVFGEDHSFPRHDWAEKLVQAHEQAWAAVGPRVCNANPRTKVARADYLIAYGQWGSSVNGGEVEHLPGHNSSYKRALLLEYGSKLDDMLEAESVLHWDLRRNGHHLLLESAARTSHMNFSCFLPWAFTQLQAGIVFAAFRAHNENWPLSRRLFFILAAPLIPFIRLRRIMALTENLKDCRNLLPILIFGLGLDGFGQMLGYAIGRTLRTLVLRHFTNFEFKRVQYVQERDAAPWVSKSYA
ncbi:MAG: glycosyltransferase [Acidobacteriaceae bacterium]|nr:glycosyltransferase [Acidobacteriaceae bacterium]